MICIISKFHRNKNGVFLAPYLMWTLNASFVYLITSHDISNTHLTYRLPDNTTDSIVISHKLYAWIQYSTSTLSLSVMPYSARICGLSLHIRPLLSHLIILWFLAYKAQHSVSHTAHYIICSLKRLQYLTWMLGCVHLMLHFPCCYSVEYLYFALQNTKHISVEACVAIIFIIPLTICHASDVIFCWNLCSSLHIRNLRSHLLILLFLAYKAQLSVSHAVQYRICSSKLLQYVTWSLGCVHLMLHFPCCRIYVFHTACIWGWIINGEVNKWDAFSLVLALTRALL